MKNKGKNSTQKFKKFTFSTTLYIAAAVVALIAVASLVDNIMLYRNSVSQYVAQGYPVALVVKQLIPSQLLPGLFDTISVYGGIALVLFSAGVINKKVSKCLSLLTKSEVCSAAAGDNGSISDKSSNDNNSGTTEPTVNSEINEESNS